MLSICAVVYEEDEQSVDETVREGRDTLLRGTGKSRPTITARQNSTSLHHPKRNCPLPTEYNDKDYSDSKNLSTNIELRMSGGMSGGQK